MTDSRRNLVPSGKSLRIAQALDASPWDWDHTSILISAGHSRSFYRLCLIFEGGQLSESA